MQSVNAGLSRCLPVSKGQDFERQVCRTLSLWWTDGEDADVFWRNRVRSTKQSPDAKHQLGDVTALKAIGAPLVERFSIEIKIGYSKTKKGTRTKNIPWDLLDLLDGKKDGKKTLLEFWAQCTKDSELSRKRPLLIFKRDFHEPVICLESDTMTTLQAWMGPLDSDYLNYRRAGGLDPDLFLFLYRLEDFLSEVTPDVIRRLK